MLTWLKFYVGFNPLNSRLSLSLFTARSGIWWTRWSNARSGSALPPPHLNRRAETDWLWLVKIAVSSLCWAEERGVRWPQWLLNITTISIPLHYNSSQQHCWSEDKYLSGENCNPIYSVTSYNWHSQDKYINKQNSRESWGSWRSTSWLISLSKTVNKALTPNSSVSSICAS